MVEIKAGRELDAAIAKAIGLYGWISVGADDHLVSDDEIPKYSTDLNAAFAAAEKVSDYVVVTKNDFSRGLWECKLTHKDCLSGWVRGDTPALAICAAILKLHSSDE